MLRSDALIAARTPHAVRSGLSGCGGTRGGLEARGGGAGGVDGAALHARVEGSVALTEGGVLGVGGQGLGYVAQAGARDVRALPAAVLSPDPVSGATTTGASSPSSSAIARECGRLAPTLRPVAARGAAAHGLRGRLARRWY